MQSLYIRLEDDLKEDSHKIADEIGISLSSLVKMLLKNVVRTGRLNIRVYPDKERGMPKYPTRLIADKVEVV